jgi:hypothetical protein
MTEAKTTSARDLRELVSKFRATTAEDNDNLSVVWAKFLGVERYSDDWFTALESFWVLTRETREQISRSTLEDSIKTDFASHIDQISLIGRPDNLNMQWKGARENVLKNDHIVKLGYIHSALRVEFEKQEVGEKELESLINEANDLFTNIQSSDLHEALKAQLARDAARIVFCLQNYKLVGARGVLNAVETVVGARVLNPGETAEIQQKAPSVWSKIGKLATRTVTVLDKAATAGRNIEYFGKMFDQIGS